GPRPLYDARRAIARARAMCGRGVYQLGTGDIDSDGDDPRDCFGFAVCELFGIKRHRPGFNRGSWATVSDDLNCNSALEDAHHGGELFAIVTRPEPGVLLAYPTIRLPGHERPWIGHIAIVVSAIRALEWDSSRPDYSLLDVVHCHGPDGRRPGITRGDGSPMNLHDHNWPKPENRTWMLRVLP
ncbi:MAG TPA: hypothetical protein VJU58_13890, partial [Microbacterium sp.]|nr:hypothetical protein [Microbacterium sp.]